MLLVPFLILAAFLFSTGIYGVLTRKDPVLLLMSLEVMLTGINLNFVAFASRYKSSAGDIFSLFVIAVSAIEVGVGLALVLALRKKKNSVQINELDSMRG